MRFEVQQLADGWPGTDATVATIVRLVNESVSDPVVRACAEDIVRDVPERDKVGEIRAISNFVRSHIRYTGEPIETIKTPRVMVDEMRRHGRQLGRKYGVATGDCDDHVTLALALHRMVGTKCDIPVISQRPDGIANHIYIRCFAPGHGWITDDLIVKKEPLGWEAPSHKVTMKKVYEAPVGRSLIPAISSLGCCGGSCCRTECGLIPESGVGQYVELIVAGVSAASTAASIAAQAAMQKKALKAQKDAMDQAQRQYEQQRADQIAAQEAAMRISGESGGSFGWGWALGALAVGGAALYLLSD